LLTSFEIFHEKVVVKNVTNDITEISVEDAIKTDNTLIVGDMYIDIIDPSIFGRRLIAHAKQHLAQKIKDIEKESVYNE
jgi:N utilization substance protein A